ncbi:MAG TPA: DUF1232 domain-containing protein [bacterium]|nr:DUF1232 domain-containing protein [bacterium]
MWTGSKSGEEDIVQTEKKPVKSMDFYQRLRRRINTWSREHHQGRFPWGEWLLTAPDLFHLLVRLGADPRVSWKHKARLAAAVTYFVSPLDFLPEMILGPIGFLDDVVLAAMVLNGIINETDPSLVEEHWAGEGDILKTVRAILLEADQMLGRGMVRRLGRWIARR